jgi:hypothetical protein
MVSDSLLESERPSARFWPNLYLLSFPSPCVIYCSDEHVSKHQHQPLVKAVWNLYGASGQAVLRLALVSKMRGLSSGILLCGLHLCDSSVIVVMGVLYCCSWVSGCCFCGIKAAQARCFNKFRKSTRLLGRPGLVTSLLWKSKPSPSADGKSRSHLPRLSMQPAA